MRNSPLSFSVNLKIDKSQNNSSQFDYWILFSIIFLCSFGLAMIYSSSNSLEMTIRQGAYFFLGLVGMVLLAFSNFRKMEVFYLHSIWPALFLLIIVLFFPSENSKTSRWIDLGLFTFQPSELMRFILPISAASFLTKNLKTKMKDMWLVIFVTLICFYLVAIQPDLGTSIIILLAGLLPVVISGFPWIYIFFGGFLATLSLPLIWMSLYDYQKQRILTLFNPEADIYGAGWNIVQSKTAIGSGGLYGKGWLNGTQSQLDFLPESHTDFIIAVLAEEFGLIGVICTLTAYAFLLSRCFFISAHAKSQFWRLFAGSFAVMIFAHIFVNLGMVSGILPIVGAPLLLISFGGNSALTLFMGFGILTSISHEPRRIRS